MSRDCLQISIIPSSVIEPMESFTLALNTSAVDALTGSFAETTVFILGDGGKYLYVYDVLSVNSKLKVVFINLFHGGITIDK